MRQIFYATTVTALIAAAVACSDNNNKGDAGPGTQVCPTTIVAATSTATGTEGANDSCHVDRYICVVGFQCGNFTQQATCTCNGNTSKFECVLAANNNPVPDDTTDTTALCSSIANPVQPDTCPTTVAAAKDAQGNPVACKNAGQVCTYATTCTTSPPPQDVCQCKANGGGSAGLSWACDVHECP
jgi:hypothetical protein